MSILNNAPVTMSILNEGSGTHFLMFLQHMVKQDQMLYLPEDTPIHSEANDYNNRWDTWTHGRSFSFQTPGDAQRNITLGGTSWNDKNNTETTEERLAYFDSIIEEHGAIHFGPIHHYPVWLEAYFSNITVLFYLGETEETSKRCYNLFEIKNGFVPKYNPTLGQITRSVVKNNVPECTVDYNDLYIKNDREAVRTFINYTLSITITEEKLDKLQYWIDLYTTRNNKLLAKYLCLEADHTVIELDRNRYWPSVGKK